MKTETFGVVLAITKFSLKKLTIDAVQNIAVEIPKAVSEPVQ